MATSTKYDRQDVIQKATNLFWEKGFHATSMRNLQEAIDMRPGSIYAGFGSKEGLFKESLHYYANRSVTSLNSFSEQFDSPLEALKQFIINVVVSRRCDQPSSLCMLVKTISELTEENSELLEEAQQLLGKMEEAFADLLTQAQTRGELNQSKDPKRLASLLQLQLMGSRAYARANEGTDADIEGLIGDMFDLLVR